MPLPTSTPLGSDPAGITKGEILRNIITDLGGTTPVDLTSLDILLQALNLTMWLNCIMGPEYSAAMNLANVQGTTLPRANVDTATTAIATGTLYMAALYLRANTVITNLNFMPGTTGDAGPTHQWMALFSAARVQLAASADATSAVITASTPVVYPIATVAAGAGTTYTTTTAGLYYLGLCITTANAPVMETQTSVSGSMALAPILTGTSTGNATPPAFPNTAAAITATATYPLMWVT